MKILPYPQIGETLYFERLSNGLPVYVLPKPGFQKTYATFTTRYGSIDNRFQVEGLPECRVPNGIAHFLEHKMFEEPKGDVFARFASQGGSANAFTSFDRTSYLFTATEQIHANLETLIDFVQNPYFTDENVEKEKGIIGQEIKMYQDNPDWQVYFGLIEALYQVHPVHIDIAGTIESISQITKETLYECYRTFYHPQNMLLFVVGGVDPEEVMMLVRDNQEKKEIPPQGKISRFFDPEPEAVRQSRIVKTLPVSLPKCYIGLKEKPVGTLGKELLKRECETKLMTDALFSPSSPLYQSLYDDNLISDNFSYEYQCAADYGFVAFGGDTRSPELLLQRVREHIGQVREKGIPDSDFNRIKKKKIGNFLRMLNSPEAIAHEFTKYRFRDSDLFDVLPALESVTREDVHRRMNELFDWRASAVSIVSGEGHRDE